MQKEYSGIENKSETETLLRRAMEDYEEKRFVAKPDNLTLGDLLDLWVEEKLKPGTLKDSGTPSGPAMSKFQVLEDFLGKKTTRPCYPL